MGETCIQTKSNKMSRQNRHSSHKKQTRTLSKIEQTLLEEERREKQKNTSLFQKNKKTKTRKYKKTNTQPTIQYKTQIQIQKREKRETTQAPDKGNTSFRRNPNYKKMSWVEMDEMTDDQVNDFWVIDSDEE